jgi:hypothetical protein
MPTKIPTTFSGDEMLAFHRFRLTEQVDESVTEEVANLAFEDGDEEGENG